LTVSGCIVVLLDTHETPDRDFILEHEYCRLGVVKVIFERLLKMRNSKCLIIKATRETVTVSSRTVQKGERRLESLADKEISSCAVVKCLLK